MIWMYGPWLGGLMPDFGGCPPVGSWGSIAYADAQLKIDDTVVAEAFPELVSEPTMGQYLKIRDTIRIVGRARLPIVLQSEHVQLGFGGPCRLSLPDEHRFLIWIEPFSRSISERGGCCERVANGAFGLPQIVSGAERLAQYRMGLANMGDSIRMAVQDLEGASSRRFESDLSSTGTKKPSSTFGLRREKPSKNIEKGDKLVLALGQLLCIWRSVLKELGLDAICAIVLKCTPIALPALCGADFLWGRQDDFGPAVCTACRRRAQRQLFYTDSYSDLDTLKHVGTQLWFAQISACVVRLVDRGGRFWIGIRVSQNGGGLAVSPSEITVSAAQ